VILKTPFILFYRVASDRVEVLRVWDGRALHGKISAPSE
jgi:hypothetical protein